MEKFIEKVATENAFTLIDAMVKNFINDFFANDENELTLDKVDSYIEYVNGLKGLNTTICSDYRKDFLAVMSANLHYVSAYMVTLNNWEIMPMADDDDLKMAFENRVNDCMYNIKLAIKTYVYKRNN